MRAAKAAILLLGVILGAGLTFFGTRSDVQSESDVLLWTYTRNTGPEKWPDEGVSDPSHVEKLSEYAIKTANECRLSKWHLESSETVTDIDVGAQIRLPIDEVTNAQFDCLASRVRPPYVTLQKVSADPQKRTAL